jgi:tetratricopeptide (TPR) repeat protein
MGLKDCRGVPVSTKSRTSLQRYESAVELFHGYYGDPLGVIDSALAEDPDFVMGHCLRAALMLTSSDKAAEPALRSSVEAGEKLSGRANERERAHLAAAREWLEGRFESAVQRYGEILLDFPRDTLAIQVAHLGDFFLGQSTMLRDRVAQTLPHWSEQVPGYGFVLGMYAFGLEETALFGQAEAIGRRALDLNARDPWAVHAVAHVMEMQGRVGEGIEWLSSRAPDWAPDNGFAFHNWWHLALYHLDRGDTGRVLELYDSAIRRPDSTVVLELIDASALLWRLHLRGVNAGDRWARLADLWERRIEDAYYTFNDAHAMMAFVATGRTSSIRALINVMECRVSEGGTNGRMTLEVGLPLCRALEAFGNGHYAMAAEILQPLRLIAHRFGGSHAQRDLLHLTLIESAMRARRLMLARALVAERTALKPASTANWQLTARTLKLLGDEEAAQAANRRSEQAAAGSRPAERLVSAA